jgi:polyisoprenoid-binding protein YceI
MQAWRRIVLLVSLALTTLPLAAWADTATFAVNTNSRASFKTEAPLETIIGTVATPGNTPMEQRAIIGTITVDLAKPHEARGTVKVDLAAVKTGVDRRDAHMRSKDFLDTDAGDPNRWATFDIKNVELAGPLQPGKEVPAKVRGTFTVRGKPIERLAEGTMTYVKLSPEQAEQQKRFGFTGDNLRVKLKFDTKFTNHAMQVPQLLILKLSDDIQVETDLILVKQ